MESRWPSSRSYTISYTSPHWVACEATKTSGAYLSVDKRWFLGSASAWRCGPQSASIWQQLPHLPGPRDASAPSPPVACLLGAAALRWMWASCCSYVTFMTGCIFFFFFFPLKIARNAAPRGDAVNLNFFLLPIIFKSWNVTVFRLWIRGNCVYCLMCFRNPCYFSSLNTRKQACNASLKGACRGALWGS